MNKQRIKKLQQLEFKQKFKINQNDINDYTKTNSKLKKSKQFSDFEYLKKTEKKTFLEWKKNEMKIKNQFKELFDDVKDQQNPTFFFANQESRKAPTFIHLHQIKKRNPDLFQSRFQFNRPKSKTLLKNLKKASTKFEQKMKQIKKTLYLKLIKGIKDHK